MLFMRNSALASFLPQFPHTPIEGSSQRELKLFILEGEGFLRCQLKSPSVEDWGCFEVSLEMEKNGSGIGGSRI